MEINGVRMIIYDGKYNWQGKKRFHFKPVSWWPGSYHLTIIDLSKSMPDVYLMKPYVVIVSNTGNGISSINCTDNFAKSVCRDFKLNIERVLWIEYHPKKPAHMDVATFKPVTTIGSETLYSVKWRSIMPNELEVIKGFSTAARDIAASPH